MNKRLWIGVGMILIIMGVVNALPYVQLRLPLGIHNNSKDSMGEDIVGNWWFEQNSTDASGWGNHGVWSGADGDENVTGIVGNAYSFDGKNDYITTSLSQTLNISKAVTVSLWFNPKRSDGSVAETVFLLANPTFGTAIFRIIHQSNFISLALRTNNLYSSLNTNGIYTVNANSWYHVVVTYDPDADYATIYANGVLRRSSTSFTTPLNSSGAVAIGSTGSAYQVVNGTIDEVMIFNRTLSSGEINFIYNQSKSGYHTLFPEKSMPYVQLGESLEFD